MISYFFLFLVSVGISKDSLPEMEAEGTRAEQQGMEEEVGRDDAKITVLSIIIVLTLLGNGFVLASIVYRTR